jgi:hypothetical protein
MEEKEVLRNESVYVRRSAAGNPNTFGAVLAELAKDSDWSVRSSAAGNPNADEPIKYKFIVTKTYVATNGTSHIWYKHKLSQYRAVLYLWMFLRFP